MLALALMPLGAAAQSLTVTLQSGETVRYPIEEVVGLSFDESQLPPEPPQNYVALTEFTDPMVLAEVSKGDTDKDGRLSEAEIEALSVLDLSNKQVKSLAGIKHLTALKKLLMQGCSGLEEIDLSNCCPDLEELQTGFFSSLKTLRLGEKKALRQLYTMHNGLETLEFTALPALEEMTIAGNNLVTFTLRDCKNLRRFTAGGDKLKSFDLSGCDNLSVLSISGSTDFEAPDFSAFPALRELTMSGTAIREFTTETNRQLVSLDLGSSPSLRKVDVSKSVKLNSLSLNFCYDLYKVTMYEGQVINSLNGVSNEMITRVPREYPEDVAAEIADPAFRQIMIETADTDKDGKISIEEANAVTSLSLAGKGLRSADIFYFENITDLDLSGNELTEIDLSMQMGLRNLNLSGNKLTRLDVKRQTALETLDASGNALEEVSDMASKKIVSIDLSDNRLTRARFYFLDNLVKLDLSNNEIATAEIRENSKLADMDVSHNKISEITMWSLKGLVNVKFNDNPFIQLDEAGKWTLLETIDCSNTSISRLDLSGNTALRKCVATGCPSLATIHIPADSTAEVIKDDATALVKGAPAE